MKNKVGFHVPGPEEMETLRAEVNAVLDKIRSYTVTLAADERRRVLRFRPGSDRLVGLLAELAEKHCPDLPGASIDGMKADLALARRLQPLGEDIKALLERVEDTVIEAQAECWWTAMTYYTALWRLAEDDPELAQALGPATDFFTMGRRTRKVGPVSTEPAALDD